MYKRQFEYNTATQQWQQIPSGSAFPVDDPGDPDDLGPQNGDLFRLTSPASEAGIYRFDGSDWNPVTVDSGAAFPAAPADGDLFTLLAGAATGLTIDETSLAVPEFDMGGNLVGTEEALVGEIAFAYNSLIDVTVGIDLGEIADGSSIDSNIAFVRINAMDASVSMDFTDISLSLSIDGPVGSLGAVLIAEGSFFLSGGVSMVSDPLTLTLADIVDGVSLVENLDFVSTGSVSAELPLVFDVSVGAPIDTTQFGSPVVLIDDANLFDDTLPEIRVSFIIGPALQTALLDLAGYWDSLIGEIFGNSGLSATLPLIGDSVLGLLGGIDGGSIVDTLSIQSVLTDYFTTEEPTVEGLIELLTNTLNQVIVGLPFDISGGLQWPEIGGAFLSLDIDIDIEQAFALDVNVIELLADTGQTAQIFNALSGLGVELTGDFLLEIEAALQGAVALTIDVTDLVNGTLSLGNEDFTIELLEELVVDLTVSVSDLDLGIDFSAAVPGLAPGIEAGTLDLFVSGTLGLTDTATERIITGTEFDNIADHVDVELTGSFATVLPLSLIHI